MPRLPKQCNMDLDQNEPEINLFFEEFPKKLNFIDDVMYHEKVSIFL